jgi:hypothetical protein
VGCAAAASDECASAAGGLVLPLDVPEAPLLPGRLL